MLINYASFLDKTKPLWPFDCDASSGNSSSSSGSNSKITIIKEGETMKPKPFADSAQHRLVAFAYISLVAYMRLVKTAR